MIAEVNKKDILNYCELYSNNDSDLLKDLIKHTYKVTSAPQMISGIQVGNFLQSLILLSQSKSILEIGMFTGYSALKMAEVLPNRGTIDTCELADNHIKTANLFFKKSKYGQKIKIHSGPALTSIKKFKENSFDMCFIDADKNNYINYYHQCIKLIKPNGFIVIDNMLWGGEVLNPKDKESKIIMETAQIINNDSKVHNIMLAIRDGLMLCVKK